MKRACALACHNVKNKKGGPFGCVIVKSNKVIAEGVNGVVCLHDPTAHAEMQAIRKACERLQTHDLSGCQVYTSCEPCSMCFSALRWAGIDEIYFHFTRHDAATIGFRDDDIYNQIIERKQDLIPFHVCLSPSEDAFHLWSSTLNNVMY